MSRHILLDSSPLSVLSKPACTAEVVAINSWIRDCLKAGHSIHVPEVIDCELRRELPWAGKISSITMLDSLKLKFSYLPLTTAAMLLAAELWAESRRSGQPTGDPLKLDIDAILAAQALTLDIPSGEVIVATSNPAHLSRFVAADLWSNITPE